MQKFFVVETIIKPAVQTEAQVVAISRSKYDRLVENGLTEGAVRCASKNKTVEYSL